MARRREEYRESRAEREGRRAERREERQEERRPRRRESRYEKEYVSTNRQYEARERGRRGEEAKIAETKVEDWAEMKDSPIRQEGESTFRYRERKDRLMEEDARRIESTELPQM